MPVCYEELAHKGYLTFLALTYMSIRDEINDWVRRGALFQLRRTLLSDSVDRTLLMSSEIKALVDGPWIDETMSKRCGRLRADLEAFVGGDLIPLCLNPLYAKTAYMGLLYQSSLIRTREPIGAFRWT